MAWTDQLLRDRQTDEISRNRFGKGNLIAQPVEKDKEVAADDDSFKSFDQDRHDEVVEEEEDEDGGGEQQAQKNGGRRFPEKKSHKMQSNTDNGGGEYGRC